MERPESEVKKQAATWLKGDPGLFSFHYSAYHGVAGIPDRLGYIGIKGGGCIPFAIEFKREGKDLSPLQRSVCKKLRKMGVNVLAPCYTLQEVKEFINKLKQQGNNNETNNS